MKLWCLRHPEPDIAAGVCYGWMDMPAKAAHLLHVQQWVGHQLAHAEASKQPPSSFANATTHSGAEPEPSVLPATDRPDTRSLHRLTVFSSPLQRARQLAEALQHGAHWQAPIIDDRLREMHFGDWEGQRWSDIARDQIDAWSAALVDHRPPGGESVRDLAARVSDWLQTRRHATSGERDCMLVAHAGVIQVVAHLAEHTSIDGFKPTLRLGYGDLLLLDCSGPHLQRHHLRCPPLSADDHRNP